MSSDWSFRCLEFGIMLFFCVKAPFDLERRREDTSADADILNKYMEVIRGQWTVRAIAASLRARLDQRPQ